MMIDTHRFGCIEVPEEAVIRFPRGLYGLEPARDYCLLPHSEEFHWLQAIDVPAIALVVTDPFQFFPEYEVVIPDDAAALLQARMPTDVAVYTSVAVDREDGSITTNLLGPVVINHGIRRGLQLVLDGKQYGTRHGIGRAPGVERTVPGTPTDAAGRPASRAALAVVR